MKLYIINVSEKRKNELTEHLMDRNIKDFTWVGEYLNTDPFVLWLKKTSASHMHLNTISNHLNWFKCLEYGINGTDDYFMVACDDVVFPKNWEERVNKLKLLPANNISQGVSFNLPYDKDYTVTGNFGGMECIIFSKQFANFILNNIDFNQCLDIVIGSMLLYHGYPLAITPICHQTSILEDKTTTGNTEYKIDWVSYTRTYKPSGMSFDALKIEFDDFLIKKKYAEDLFYTKFNKKIDIWNLEYIHVKNILKC